MNRIKILKLLGNKTSPKCTLQLVLSSYWSTTCERTKRTAAPSARVVLRRREMTADSCCALRQAGSVTPGTCQSLCHRNTSCPDIAWAPAKHALSGVIHPHMSAGSLRLSSSCHCKSQRGRERKGRGREASIYLHMERSQIAWRHCAN